jgi:type III pantothenate kinase
MLLAIDIGNTNITFGLFEGEDLIGQYRLASDLHKNQESYAIDIVELFVNDNIDCLKISNIIIASVVPDLTKVIKPSLERFFNGEIIVLDKNQIKIDIELKDKDEVGIDRLVNAFAAYKEFGSDLIIVDFGTATTFDVVGPKGQYLGGVIAPGVNLSIKALHDMTAKLPNIKVRKQSNVIGKSTREAMNSGIYFGYISLIEGLIAKIQKEYGKKMKIISTGGLSSLFSDAIKEIEYVEADLTLKGLRLIQQ